MPRSLIISCCILAVVMMHGCTKSPTTVTPSTPMLPPAGQSGADSIPGYAPPYIVVESNDPYQTLNNESELLIHRTDLGFEETISLAYGLDGNLFQATERRPLYGIDRNYVFSYDHSKQRIHPHWTYSYDQAAQINRIEFSTPELSRLYLVSSEKLDLFRLIIRQLLPNGDIRHVDTSTYRYTYNQSGDPSYVDCTYRTSSGVASDFAYKLEFTDILSPLNNDPLNHFGNLNFWLDGTPIVSRHLLATMKIFNSPLDFGWVDDMTDAEKFSYGLDSKNRPVSITVASTGTYPISPKHYYITYPQ